MKVNRVKTDGIKGKDLNLYFMGDFHIGSRDIDMRSILRDIDKIKKDKNALVILMGDTIDCALKHSVGAGAFDNDLNPEEQIDTAITILTPIKKKILGVHNGNHAYRIEKETTLSPEKMIANSLGVPYLGDTCFHHIRFKDQTYVVYTMHGTGDIATYAGALSKITKSGEYQFSDISAMGHSHQLGFSSGTYLTVDKKDKTMIERRRYNILTGGYLNWQGSYAEGRYSPTRKGCARAVLNGKEFSIRIELV